MTNTTETSSAEPVTWLIVSRFAAPVDLNDDHLLNGIAQAIDEAGGTNEDSIIGNLVGTATGSLDDAYDAARGYLTATVRR